jgi:hypothetical protein
MAAHLNGDAATKTFQYEYYCIVWFGPSLLGNWKRSSETDLRLINIFLWDLVISAYLHALAIFIGGYWPLYMISGFYLIMECFINLFHLPETVFQVPTEVNTSPMSVTRWLHNTTANYIRPDRIICFKRW